MNPEDFSAAPALVRKTAEAGRRSPGTALNFVVEDGSADETALAAFLAPAAALAGRLRRSGLRTGDVVAIRGGGGSRAVSEAIVACTLAGLVAAPLVSLLGDADVDMILDTAGARGLRAARLGLRLSRGYGSTEHPTATTHHADDPLEQRAEPDGRPLNGTRVRVIGPDGCDLAAGHDGEVLLAGPEQTPGYLSGDTSAFLPGGWFRTGDVGHLTGAGELVITGRIKEIIIRGGENISVTEVEQLLQEHPDIAEAAVVGVPDAKFAERAHAFIVLRPGSAPVDVERVRGFFDERRVSRFKTPEYVTTVPRLPRNGLGKVQKHLLVADVGPRDA